MFVLKRTYDKLERERENDVWFLRKRIKEVEQQLSGLEAVCDTLVKQNRMLCEDNTRLCRERQILRAAARKSESIIKDYKLKIMSLEAHWKNYHVGVEEE